MEISHGGGAGLAVQQQWKTAHAAARSIRVRHQEDRLEFLEKRGQACEGSSRESRDLCFVPDVGRRR